MKILLHAAALALAALTPLAAPAAVPTCTYRVAAAYPHDRTAFTEGLFYRAGLLYESTGREGASRIIVRTLASTKPVRETAIDARYFGEGIVDWKNELISLTWRNGIGYRWDIRTLRQLGSFPIETEGWGMTRDGQAIYQSDGSSTLRVRDPLTMRVRRTLAVTADGAPVPMLNELEWIDGEIWANVWLTDRIARIDPATGHVTRWIDLAGLGALADATGSDDVLNGIAYDARTRRIFVTGKDWSKIFAITLACP